MEIPAIHFEKDVIPWFQMLQHMESVNSWSDLTHALESQFGPSPFDCPMGELFKLQQTGTVSDYYLKFMALANRPKGLSNEAVLNCFFTAEEVFLFRCCIKNLQCKSARFFCASSTDVWLRPKLACSHLFGQQNISPSRQKEIIY